MRTHELVEAVEPVLENVAAGSRAAQGPGDHEEVPGHGAGSARHALARPERGDGDEPAGRGGVPPDDRHAGLVSPS